jgi:hypothetical protein
MKRSIPNDQGIFAQRRKDQRKDAKKDPSRCSGRQFVEIITEY